MNGGVWWQNAAGDDNINAITTGLFMTLSAWLYEATGNAQYLTAAKNARTFIINHIFDGTKPLVYDTIHGKDCSAYSLIVSRLIWIVDPYIPFCRHEQLGVHI